MKISTNGFSCLTALLGLCAPAFATVTITSLTSSVKSPQKVGASIKWTAKATDTAAGPVTFQFNVTPPGGKVTLYKDYNVGTLSAGTWTSQAFVWVPTGIAGKYTITVAAKDFTANVSATPKMATFTLDSLVTGTTPVVVKTANPLVALFSAPACAAGSTQRVAFEESGTTTVNTTNYMNCDASAALTFEVAGMYPSKTYTMYSETKNTGGTITNGPMVSFTTGALPTLPSGLAFPTFTVNTKGGDTTNPMLLLGPVSFAGTVYPAVATDLSAKVMWYYYDPVSPYYTLLTRPLANNTDFPYPTMLVVQDGAAWDSAVTEQQYLRQIDLAGNVVKETNIGVIQQELLHLSAAEGGPATDAGPCDFASPAPVGSACLGGFHHDAIQTLPNGDTAVIGSIEKIFPAGTQGDTSGLPVDVIGDIIIVLNSSWQVVWYWDSFASYGLNVSRAAVLGETCVVNENGCPPIELLGSGIAPTAKDWLHGNSLYYWPTDTSGGASGDIVFSMKDQDWVIKINYDNGTGNKAIIWTMGLDGTFTFNNIFSDPYPWFSHQHEVGIEKSGAGPMSLFDNGDTRVTMLGSPGCEPNDCNSRGIALTVDETTMQVTPVLSDNLGYYSSADGSAQLLADGNYYFLAATVFVGLDDYSYALDLTPSGGTGGATTTLNVQGPTSYRGWQVTNLYNPPTT